MSANLEEIQKMVQMAILEHDRSDGDMGPASLAIGITEVLVRDFADELIGLLHAERLDRVYAEGYKYGQRYPVESPEVPT